MSPRMTAALAPRDIIAIEDVTKRMLGDFMALPSTDEEGVLAEWTERPDAKPIAL